MPLSEQEHQEGATPEPSDASVTVAATPAPDPLADEIKRLEAEIAKEEGAAPGAQPQGEAAAATPAAAAPAAPAPAAAPAAPAATPPAQPETTPAAQPAAEAGKPEDAVIALRRKNQELTRELRKRDQDLAYQKGLNDGAVLAGAAKAAPENLPAPPAMTPEERTKRVRDQKYALAAEYDVGRLNAVDWERRRDALDDELHKIREEERRATATAQAAPRESVSLMLEERTNELIKTYPILSRLTKSQTDILVELAYEQAAVEGVEIHNTELGTLELRRRVGELANKNFGGSTAPASAAAAPAAADPSKPPTQQQPAALSREAQARADKLELQQRMPPDASSVGSAAQPGAGEEELLVRLRTAKTEDERIAVMLSVPGLVENQLGVRSRPP